MTEDEAKTQMCCGPPAVAAATYWRGSAACDAPMHCIGSACMAWRWARVANPDWKPHNQMAVFPQPNPYSDTNPQAIASTTQGYCGLAGAVQ